MSKSGRQWIEMLPKHIQSQLMEAIRDQKGSQADQYLDRMYEHMESIVNTPITWRNTVQGSTYWNDIYYAIREGKKNDVLDLDVVYKAHPEFSNRENQVINSYSIY